MVCTVALSITFQLFPAAVRGDLMRKDQSGYFYFIDRVGDTFRWKGENVSTTEVAETVSGCPGVTDAIVYGVTIPGTEGRVGMATVVVSQDFDLVAFRQHLAERLPEYARPLFVRVRGAIEMTTTFKPKKQELSRDNPDGWMRVSQSNERWRTWEGSTARLQR
jgi:fatty-acyl-CoA synthase